MRWWIRSFCLVLGSAAGCTAAPPVDTSPGPISHQVHWETRERPYPMRIGQLDAVAVNRVHGRRDVRLELGGMIVRHYVDSVPIDELLLYFRAPRAEMHQILPNPGVVELRVGRETYRYVPPPGRSLSGSQRDGDVLIDYILVPVDPCLLSILAEATFVEGRIGDLYGFEVRRRVLSRLDRLLRLVPPDARFDPVADATEGLVLAVAPDPV